MGLDIRLPLGMLFAIVGLILAVYGAVTHGDPMYGASGGLNVNLLWGSLLLVGGLVTVSVARRR